MQIPPLLMVERAMAQQNVALSVIKQSAQADAAIASIVQEAADSIELAAGRGGRLNIRA